MVRKTVTQVNRDCASERETVIAEPLRQIFLDPTQVVYVHVQDRTPRQDTHKVYVQNTSLLLWKVLEMRVQGLPIWVVDGR
jgi:hypothetical protein